MAGPDPEVLAYQKAHPNDFNAGGLKAFIIAGVCIITVMVGLRLWCRKMQKIPWNSDHDTLIGALVITCSSFALNDVAPTGVEAASVGIDSLTSRLSLQIITIGDMICKILFCTPSINLP